MNVKKVVVFALAIQVIACNGRLSDEQKRKIIDEMESSQIVKIPEATITEAAFEYGRTIVAPLEARDQQLMNQKLIDSLQEAFHVNIKALNANDSLLREVEKKMIEAYLGAGSEQLTDNVQKMGVDSIFYTKPFMKTHPDGSVELIKVVGIKMSKREVIKQIKK
jgi:hypothetical protein